MRLERHEQEAGEEQAVNRADAGGLEDCDKAGDFLPTADSFLARQRGKEILEEGNDSFGGFCQNPVFVRSAGGSSEPFLRRMAPGAKRRPRRLGWFVGFDQMADVIEHV